MSDGIESQNLRRVMRQNMRDKLPEWPELPALAQPLTQFDVAKAYHQYEHAVAEAAIARMEALVEYAQHTGAWCGQDSGHACTCGLSELLAACDRRSGG